jgi:hypothetical protein
VVRVTAVIYDLSVVRGAADAAVPLSRPLTPAEIDAEVSAIRAELRRPLERLAFLREAGAHLTAFGPGTSWHEACMRWFGDLADLRLTGTRAAIEEREHLIWSMREAGDSSRVIRDRLGVGAQAVADALAKRDPAPEKVTGADGVQRPARTGAAEPAAPEPLWQRALTVARRRPDGVTLVELAQALRITEGSASGLLSYLGPATARHPHRKGLLTRTEERRDRQRVHRPVTA